jgi:hypothetical protein
MRVMLQTLKTFRLATVQVWRWLKWVLFALSAWYMYTIFSGNQLKSIVISISDTLTSTSAQLLLGATLLLSAMNWSIEAYKWKLLVRKFQSIRFIQSIQAILAGTTVSLRVPNRTGEYLGRVLFIRQENRIRAILATFVGSLAQLLITLIAGIFGLLIYNFHRIPALPWIGELALGIISISLLLVFYFNIRIVRKLIPKRRNIRFIRKWLSVYKSYTSADLAKVLLLSLGRYFIFSLQYYLLLLFFGVDIPAYLALPTIALAFFIQTVIPSNGLTELSSRGITSALFLPFTPNLLPVAAAAYSLWIINLLLPSIAGLVLLLPARRRNAIS